MGSGMTTTVELATEGEMRALAKEIGVSRATLNAAAYAALRRELELCSTQGDAPRRQWARWIQVYGFQP